MEFTQRRMQKKVLAPRQDPVADELVEGHPAAARAAFFQHPRTEDCIRRSVSKWEDEIRKTFGRILTIAVKKRDEIETTFDREMKTNLLVPAVTLIHRIEKNVKRGRQRLIATH